MCGAQTVCHAAATRCFQSESLRYFHTEPPSIRKSFSNALGRIAPFSDRNRNIHLKYKMPLWAIGVANADKESVKNTLFVSITALLV
jgi:hypothetical protein